MRNKKIAAYLCMGLLLLMTAGCGNSDADSDVSKVDTINFNDVIDANMEENSSNHQGDEENVNNQQGSDEKNENSLQGDKKDDNNTQQDSKEESTSNQSQTNSELEGNIESIGDNSIVINKTFHPSSNTAVSYGDEKVLVTVYFSEETKYEVWTVKNGGVNGDSDIDKREGGFSDIKNQLSVKLTGVYKGNDFHAKQVIIYNFV